MELESMVYLNSIGCKGTTGEQEGGGRSEMGGSTVAESDPEITILELETDLDNMRLREN